MTRFSRRLEDRRRPPLLCGLACVEAGRPCDCPVSAAEDLERCGDPGSPTILVIGGVTVCRTVSIVAPLSTEQRDFVTITVSPKHTRGWGEGAEAPAAQPPHPRPLSPRVLGERG